MRRCLLPAWLFGWVTAIFLPGAVLALTYLGVPLSRLPEAVWRMGDDIGPVAKLMLGALLFIGFLAVDRRGITGQFSHLLASVAGAAIAMLATIALVPPSYSRGFALGLTGTRFDLATLPAYLIGAVLAGVVFSWSIRRCQRRL